jgi:hypothetical protein
MFKDFKVGDSCQISFIGEIIGIRKSFDGDAEEKPTLKYKVVCITQDGTYCDAEVLDSMIFPLPEPEEKDGKGTESK